MTDIELGWLTGLIDGEGCITLHRVSGRLMPVPNIQITNTDLPLMEKAKVLLEEIADTVFNIKPQNMKGKYGKRQCYVIQTRKQANLAKILPKLIPCLVAKKLQAELVLEFVNSRLSTPRKPRFGVRGGQDKPYSEYERELAYKVQYLNSYSHRRE